MNVNVLLKAGLMILSTSPEPTKPHQYTQSSSLLECIVSMSRMLSTMVNIEAVT